MRWIPILMLLLGTSLTGLAQAESDGRILFKITRFDPADRPPPEFRIGAGEKATTVAIPLTHIAGPFEATLRNGRILDFFSPQSEEPQFSAKIPREATRDLLLILVPDGDSFRVIPVHSPISKLKGGDRFIVNATSSEMAVKFGTSAKPLRIKPGGSTILAGSTGTRTTMIDVDIKELTPEKDWKLVVSETWACDPRFRKFLFLYRSPTSNHILFHSVSERITAPLPAP